MFPILFWSQNELRQKELILSYSFKAHSIMTEDMVAKVWVCWSHCVNKEREMNADAEFIFFFLLRQWTCVVYIQDGSSFG